MIFTVVFILAALLGAAAIVLDLIYFKLWVVVLFFAVAEVLIIYVLLLRCRKGHPEWKTFEKYRYAHRGLHDLAHGIPENSLAAFRRAASHGFGVELDVHLTKDKRLVVVHDCDLERVTGKKGRVTELTAEELAGYRLGGTAEHVPFFEEVLPIFEQKTPIIVELKTDDGNAAELAKAASDMLDKFRVDYCMESFDPRAVRWLRKNRPEICRGQLSCHFTGKDKGFTPAKAFIARNLLFCFLVNPDFIAYEVHHRELMPLKFCRAVWGAREVSWTIRTSEELHEVEADRCVPIFENFIP